MAGMGLGWRGFWRGSVDAGLLENVVFIRGLRIGVSRRLPHLREKKAMHARTTMRYWYGTNEIDCKLDGRIDSEAR